MKRIDLTGQVFGELTVIEYAGDRKWTCRCSCGNQLDVEGNSLRKGTAHSCGHDNPKAFKDITGQQFGEWKVIRYIDRGYWECQCSCGYIKNVAGWHLRSGRSTSCGHGKTGFAAQDFKESKEVSANLVDIEIGAHINEWTILEYLGGSYYLCKCSCGNTRRVKSWALKSGHSKSCGECKFDDLSGQHFGEWDVIKYAGDSKWTCKCSCGIIRDVRKQDLINGKSTCCGSREHREHTIITKEAMQALILNISNEKGSKTLISDLAKYTEYSYGYMLGLLRKYGIRDMVGTDTGSSYEDELIKFIGAIDPGIEITTRRRDIISHLELDIYLPEYKLAIEFNGTYWHSSKLKDKMYHFIKTNACEDSGIRLIHIFEYEWLDSKKTRIDKEFNQKYHMQ